MDWESPNSDEGTYTVLLCKYTYFVVEPQLILSVLSDGMAAMPALGESRSTTDTPGVRVALVVSVALTSRRS